MLHRSAPLIYQEAQVPACGEPEPAARADMRNQDIPEEYQEVLKKQNRLKRLMPKTHKIFIESGRSLKNLWQKIVERAKKGA